MFESWEPPFDPEECPAEELTAWLAAVDADTDSVDGGVAPEVADPLVALEAAAAVDDVEQAQQQSEVDELDADATLAEAGRGRVAERLLLARRLGLAAHWADLNAVLDVTWPLPGTARLVRLGGDGTPEVAEFAPAELGAVLGIGTDAADGLIADALDLRHRFPLLWSLVQAGAVDVWIARRTVQRTRTLTLQAAAVVDRRVSHLAGTLRWARLRPIIDAAMLAADPPPALSGAEQAEADAGAWVDDDIRHGYTSMLIKAAAGDVLALDKALDMIARALKILGDPGTADQRRARAVGIIADPQTAQEIVRRADATRRAQSEAAAARRAGHRDTAESIEQTIDRNPVAFGSAVLYFHLTRESLQAILDGHPGAGAAVVRVEDIGPVIADQVRRWLQHTHVTVKPVIDLAAIPPADRYEVTPALSEAVTLINPADTYPHATCLTRHQDNDHTTPYLPMNRGGPPGQTHPDNLGKLTRRHHRIKTFAGWHVTQLSPGVRLWRTPHGYHYLTDHHGTTNLGTLT